MTLDLLKTATEDYDRAQAAAADAKAVRDNLIRQALRDGARVTDVVRITGVSRETVRKLGGPVVRVSQEHLEQLRRDAAIRDHTG